MGARKCRQSGRLPSTRAVALRPAKDYASFHCPNSAPIHEGDPIMRLPTLLAACLFSSASTVSAGAPFTITPIVVEGDSVAGVARVSRVDNLAVNDSASWLVEVDTDFANTTQDQFLLR